MSTEIVNLLLKKAEDRVDQVKARGGKPTQAEKAEIEGYLKRVREIRDTDKLRAEVEEMQSPSTGDGTGTSSAGAKFVSLLSSAGFHLKANPSVEISAHAALKQTVPGPGELSPRGPSGVVPMGRDARFLHRHLPTADLDGDTAIQDFRQTARSVSGDVERDPFATTEKATLSTTVEAVTVPVRQFAVLVRNIPNAVLQSTSQFRAFWDQEGRFQLDQAIDSHVLAQIEAANPPAGEDGTTLIEKVRNAVAAVRASGAEPDLLTLNPVDAAALDLATDDGGYIFPTRDSGVGSPLWGLRVVERAGTGTEPPLLLDTSTIGLNYLGGLRVDADAYSGFSRNTTDIRLELTGLFHVRAPWGAYRIADDS